mgnify:CR=1 FL=1
MNNIKYLPNIQKDDVDIIKKNTLNLLDYGFSNKGSYIVMDKIGIDHDNKFLTNLLELLINNHIPILKKLR